MRCAQTLKIDVSNVRIKVIAQYKRSGSVLAGNIKSGCDNIRTELSLESDAPQDRVAHLIRMAENSCFTLGALREPVPCELVATVNGEQVEIEAD